MTRDERSLLRVFYCPDSMHALQIDHRRFPPPNPMDSAPDYWARVETPGTPGVVVSEDAEVWRIVAVDPGYAVSSHGRVRNSRTLHVLKPWCAGSGYLYVGLNRSGIKTGIHRLVALAFLGSPLSALHEVAHNDGDRKNNHARNLRWATHAENMADMRKHGTTYYHGWRGETHPTAKLLADQVNDIRRRVKEGIARKTLAETYNVSCGTIDHIIQGRTWTHLL